MSIPDRHLDLLGALAVLIAPAVLSLGCGADNATTPDAIAPSPPATFADINREVLAISCAFGSCHGGDHPAADLALDVSPYANLVGPAATQRPDLRLVVPGDPDASYLYIKLQAGPPVGVPMPSGQPQGLDTDRLERVRRWIMAGARDS